MAQVALERVTKVFPPEVTAVEDLTLHVQDGEFMVLVGPSGCGKSTTLRMVAGLEEVTRGTIRIGDRVVNDVPPKHRDVAMVFQDYALYPHMTVRGNMGFALRLRRFPRKEIDRRVREAAAVLGIEPLLGRKPRGLSGGQRQRVALGRAMVRHPAVFLFDEPLSNLDASLRVEMRAELKRLHRRLGTTTIYVTHDQEEAMTLGDRMAVMRAGVLHQCGRPLEVYGTPADRFVAGFIGTPPMNFLTGRLVGQGGGVRFDDGSARILLPPDLVGAVGDRVGGTVVLGIRPEAMSAEATGRFAGEGNAVDVAVEVVEPLGEKMDVYARTPVHARLVARIEARGNLKAGQQARLYLDLRRVYLFEPGATGANLGRW